MARPLSIYIIAGEASGDLLGAHLLRAIKARHPEPISLHGIGGERMETEGVTSLFAYQELSMLGFIEVLPYAFNVFARVSQTVEDIIAKKPDIIITIDCPGFCFRVVERLRKLKFPAKFVHYVAPTVWMYKPQRAALCARLFDHLLVLLPFEPPYFEKVGLPCTFVGHAVVAETSLGDGAAFREKFSLAPETLLLCLLPGSRKSEAERLMPIFARTVTLLAAQFPGLAISVAVPKNVLPFVAPFFEGCPFRAVVVTSDTDKKNAIAASQFALVKSGTVALEVAMNGTPMVVTYKVHPISAWMLRRIAQIRFANLVNILCNREVIPELLQELCTPPALASAISALLSSPERMEAQRRDMHAALSSLLPQDGMHPSDKAAKVILDLLR